MFWGIIRHSTGLGLKAGALMGVLYFPVFCLFVGPILTLIETGHFPEANGGGSGTAVASMLGLLTGGLFGMLMGALNGLFVAVLTAYRPQAHLLQHTKSIATVCAAFNLCGVSGGLYLMFLTNLFTNFSLSPSSHDGPNQIIHIFSDSKVSVILIGIPALLAAGAAFWATARLADWYRDETAPPQNAGGPRSFFSDI